jgi:predicted transposase YdaD
VREAALRVTEVETDRLFIYAPNGVPRYGIALEVQIQPDPRQIREWIFKAIGHSRDQDLHVYLVVLYLERAGRATFHEHYRHEEDGLVFAVQFTAVLLWEHADAIRAGQYPALAPLLVLCENQEDRAVAAVTREIEILREAELPERDQRELLALAFLVATRRLPQLVLRALFGENLMLLEEVDAVRELLEIRTAQVREESRLVGREEGREEGRLEERRASLLALLQERFGEVPGWIALEARTASADRLSELFQRSVRAATVDDLQP